MSRRRSQQARLQRLERAFPAARCSTCGPNPVRLEYPGREAPRRCGTCGRELIVVELAFDPGEPSLGRKSG
ncbi:MAG: hypothetical protein ACRDNE_14150 [Gaiellaceae bacterium]